MLKYSYSEGTCAHHLDSLVNSLDFFLSAYIVHLVLHATLSISTLNTLSVINQIYFKFLV